MANAEVKKSVKHFLQAATGVMVVSSGWPSSEDFVVALVDHGQGWWKGTCWG
jgi:hypothetical protein